jgi:lysozyme family protein
MKVGFVALVAVSGGLVALQSGATPTEALVATVAGAAVGGVLLWFVLGILDDVQPGVRPP